MLFSGSFKKEATLASSQIQYYNEPLTVNLKNVTLNSAVEVLFNGVPAAYTLNQSGNNYKVVVPVTNEGLLQVNLFGPNNTIENFFVESKQPYLNAEIEYPISIDRDSKVTLNITTKNPQGNIQSAESIDADITYPDNTKKTVSFVKQPDGKFTLDFEFKQSGGYFFKVHPRYTDYIVNEKTISIQVLKPEGVHPIIWVWLGSAILWIILFVIKRFRK